jgi:2-C-methyl-D-erythritol 2,4-cyclodiphosphate synthase
MRVGIGFDVHRLVEGRRLVLGGLEIPHTRGLDGHSDADVLAHAVGDALLGALAAGDLGEHFPSSDPKWRDASGSALLAQILEFVERAGMRVSNVDAVIVCEEPRLAPYRERIRKGLAGMIRVPEERVNVKIKSGDRIGALGRGEGIAAQAVALLGEPTE